MKKIFLLLFSFFIFHFSFSWAQDTAPNTGAHLSPSQDASTAFGDGRRSVDEPRTQGARFLFNETIYDFGSVDHKLPKIEHRFEFTNDGTEPLVVTKTRTSCNCVKVQYDKKPVPPGGKGTITVIYEVNKKEAGVFYKVIEIYSNTTEKRNNLIIKGNAI